MAHETNHLGIYCDPMDVATFFLLELGPGKDMQMVASCLQCMRKMTLSHRRSTESSGGSTLFCDLVISVGATLDLQTRSLVWSVVSVISWTQVGWCVFLPGFSRMVFSRTVAGDTSGVVQRLHLSRGAAGPTSNWLCR